MILDEFDAFINDHPIGPVALDPCLHGLQGRLKVGGVISDHGAGQNGLLPLILEIHFRNGEVELPSEPRKQRLDAAALFLERRTGRQMQVNGQDADHG